MRIAPPPTQTAEVWPWLQDALVETRLLGTQLLRQHRLSLGQFLTIRWIRESDGLRLSRLADGLGVSRPAATELVAALEAKGWARRERSSADRRGVVVRITPRATRVLDAVDREFESVLRAATATLPPDVGRVAADSLKALCVAMRSRREKATAACGEAG